MPQSYACLHYHIVFSTKGRTPLITDHLQSRLFEYIAGILRAQGGHLLAAGGMPDHVHLLVDLSRQVSVSFALRDIKANSSGWIRRTFPEAADFEWQAGYAAFGVGYRDLEAVKRYISRQVEHHATVSFQEEFLALLKEHSVEYNERYIWA